MDDFAELDRYEIASGLALRLGRDAKQGRGRRDGERRRDPGCDLRRHPARDAARRRPRRGRRHAVRAPSRAHAVLQARLRYAKLGARARGSRRRRRARAARARGSSLLPVGITAVEGEFAAGDAVEIVSDGELVGKGISNYSAAELATVKGMKSERVLEPKAPRRRSTAIISCSPEVAATL